MDNIIIQGLEQNNLKHVSFTIPKEKITVFTGVSGSGKSSIVFDTIAAESQRGIIPTLAAMIDKQPFGILGVASCMNGTIFDYYIGVATGKETPTGMVEYTVPECTWAIFECVGAMPEAIQSLQKRIISEWLPNSGYEYANAPDIEVYFDGNQQADDYKCEVWFPVMKKI